MCLDAEGSTIAVGDIVRHKDPKAGHALKAHRVRVVEINQRICILNVRGLRDAGSGAYLGVMLIRCDGN